MHSCDRKIVADTEQTEISLLKSKKEIVFLFLTCFFAVIDEVEKKKLQTLFTCYNHDVIINFVKFFFRM